MRSILASDPVSQARFYQVMIELFLTEVLGILPPLAKEYCRAAWTLHYEDDIASSTLGGAVGDISSLVGPQETQMRGSMHPHILATLLGHDVLTRLESIMRRKNAGDIIVELEVWSQRVLAAAQRIQYDSQQTFGKDLNLEALPTPLSQAQKDKAGHQYVDTPVRSWELDGHEENSTSW